jgi:hypothetical protein
MACGCPVITTSRASLPEVAGDAAIYVDPDNARSLQEAFAIVRDPSRSAALSAAGARRAAAFDWTEAAAVFASALAAAAGADTMPQRQAREEMWEARRDAQNATQQALASRRRRVRPQADVPDGLRQMSQLEALALRHLPPWAVQLLRSIRASSHRRLSRLRRPLESR